MYEALVARVRYHIQKANFMGLKEAESTLLLAEAADAIEKLEHQVFLADLACKSEAAKAPRWIPVTERLPEENGRYLVRYKRDIVLDYTEVHDDEVRIMRFFVGTGWRYPFLCQPELRAAEQQTVTHWMPLPKGPKEET